MDFKKELFLFDLTSSLVGSVIGAGIYKETIFDSVFPQ
jgi:hypothetical protein